MSITWTEPERTEYVFGREDRGTHRARTDSSLARVRGCADSSQRRPALSGWLLASGWRLETKFGDA